MTVSPEAIGSATSRCDGAMLQPAGPPRSMVVSVIACREELVTVTVRVWIVS